MTALLVYGSEYLMREIVGVKSPSLGELSRSFDRRRPEAQ